MRVKISYREVKARHHNSHAREGADKFTGTVTYQTFGSVEGKPFRLSLGADADEEITAKRRIVKIEHALIEGATSSYWAELAASLPPATFGFFANFVGYNAPSRKLTAKLTWQDLCEAYELDMQRKVDNKARGATRKEGVMATSTRDRYRVAIRDFTDFVDKDTPLVEITPAHITKYKVVRHKAIVAKKQSRGGAGVALDIAVLHGMFAFAVAHKMLFEKPITMSKESKPGENPRNGARPFTADELALIRKATVHKNSRNKEIDDTHTFLLLRWTGLRASDAIRLQWKHVHFGRGKNGEIEILTQKRSKLAIIPLSSELREDLEALRGDRKPHSEDHVLLNPETGKPFTDRAILTRRAIELCARAGFKGSAHCFRDTFACDMLARGVDVYPVAKMLADTVETVEKHYAQFLPAARDAVQVKMDAGVGIEEQAKIAAQRGQRVVEIRSNVAKSGE
jgi:integrase